MNKTCYPSPRIVGIILVGVFVVLTPHCSSLLTRMVRTIYGFGPL
jgi:hypothetical protein